MKTHFLFPNKFKILGWILFIPSILTFMVASIFKLDIDKYLNIKVFAIYQESIGQKPGFFKIIEDSFSYELITILIILGGLFICFSKLKNEDEYTSKIRYESLVWATYFNYFLILFFTLFLYGMPFLNVIVYNVYTLLIFFMIRFHYLIYKLNKTSNDDE
jgi:L-asparagine transporter-like permease